MKRIELIMVPVIQESTQTRVLSWHMQQSFVLSNHSAGFINSLFKLSKLSINCPDYSTLSRRCSTLDLKMPKAQTKKEASAEEKLITLDSSGLKQYEKDEWH